jgi:hypothetical protein
LAEYTITNQKIGGNVMKRFTFLSVTILTLLTLIFPATAFAQGAAQISGTAYWPNPGQCADPEGVGSDYAVVMTGNLQGCHYTFVETSVCSPGGGYVETGHEVFVGQYNGEAGTFKTTYRFTAKYNNCNDFVEVAGRCQHPIIVDSGTGVFEGMTGRLDLRDDVVAGNFPYRGHLNQISASPPG